MKPWLFASHSVLLHLLVVAVGDGVARDAGFGHDADVRHVAEDLVVVEAIAHDKMVGDAAREVPSGARNATCN